MRMMSNYIMQTVSMQTGLMLLTLLGGFAALGSFIAGYFQTLGFRLLLVLIFINLTGCTIRRIVSYRRKIYRNTGSFILHIGLVLILIGGAINWTFGKSGRLNILEGDTQNISKAGNFPVIFNLSLHQFKIELNPDGSPAQYFSELSFDKNDQIEVVSVNHPLKNQGIKIYQESYGYTVVTMVTGTVKTAEEYLLEEGQLLTIPNTDYSLKIYRLVPSLDPGPARLDTDITADNLSIVYSIYENQDLIEVRTATLGDTINMTPDIQLIFEGIKPYTQLLIKYDPGLPLTASGCLLFLCGIFIALGFKSRNKGKNRSPHGHTISH